MNSLRQTFVENIRKKISEHKTSLPVFLLIGVLKTFSAIFLNWLFIDILESPALIGASISYGIVFVGTYIAYVKSKTIHKGFVKYTIIVLSFNALSVGLVTVLVDEFHFAGYSSSSIATAVLVLLRYITLHKFGVINTRKNDVPSSSPEQT